MKGGGEKESGSWNFKLWYTALPIATDLGKYFLPPKRSRLMECRWGWRGLVAFKTSRIRLLGYLPSRCMPLCSRLTPCLRISSLFPQLQPRQGTFKAEAGRVCVLVGGKRQLSLENWGPHLRIAASVQTQNQ